MRRKDREMSSEAAWQAVDDAPWATVSMIDPEGYPYSAVVSHAREGEILYFHCAVEGYKLDCLRAHPEVCVSCVAEARPVAGALTMAYRSAVLQGEAAEVLDEAERAMALTRITEKYDPASMPRVAAAIRQSGAHTGVWRVKAARITGKKNDSRG